MKEPEKTQDLNPKQKAHHDEIVNAGQQRNQTDEYATPKGKVDSPRSTVQPQPEAPTGDHSDELGKLKQALKILVDLEAKHRPLALAVLPNEADGEAVAQKGRSKTLINDSHFRAAKESLSFLVQHVQGWPTKGMAEVHLSGASQSDNQVAIERRIAADRSPKPYDLLAPDVPVATGEAGKTKEPNLEDMNDRDAAGAKLKADYKKDVADKKDDGKAKDNPK